MTNEKALTMHQNPENYRKIRDLAIKNPNLTLEEAMSVAEIESVKDTFHGLLQQGTHPYRSPDQSFTTLLQQAISQKENALERLIHEESTLQTNEPAQNHSLTKRVSNYFSTYAQTIYPWIKKGVKHAILPFLPGWLQARLVPERSE